ncbi:MAG: TrbC/VirB2 family protein [Pseudomonadota bacterium]
MPIKFPYAEPLLTFSNGSPIALSAEWINSVLLGPVAIGLCVLAVAFIGVRMLSGRLPLRAGLRTLLGCFILLGAPVIAAGLIGGMEQRRTPIAVAPPIQVETEEVRGELPPAEYDPYAGASLRRN